LIHMKASSKLHDKVFAVRANNHASFAGFKTRGILRTSEQSFLKNVFRLFAGI